jgi:FkbM family methyltransferase
MRIVQIGCNNCNDHVFDFISRNLDSIELFVAVDPMPACIEAARSTYNKLGSRLITVQCAISDADGVKPFYCPKNDNMSVVASLSKSHIVAHHDTGFIERGEITESWVPCLTINSLLGSFVSFEHGIDRLYIDTEGHDAKILLNLNLSATKIGFIEYEQIHADGAFKTGTQARDAELKLRIHGYEVDTHDPMHVRAIKLFTKF